MENELKCCNNINIFLCYVGCYISGGLKVWECSVDLVNYLCSSDIALRGLRVLELGCGAALPALYAYSQGANVTFQDYVSQAKCESHNIAFIYSTKALCYPEHE